MFTTVIIAALVALLFASFGTLIALKIQYRYLQRIQAQHKAWEQAQEGYLRNWETKQEKRALSIEAKLAGRVQQIEKDWHAWEMKDAGRIETLTEQYIQISADMHVERELERLPRVEETPLVFNGNGQRTAEFASWQPPALARADLAGRDLSHRYLGQADLREAQLRGASFFMSDLSGACLAGANLTEADLTGANLSYADLRNSVLTDANLQVADLRHAVLLGANLHNTRNLTTQQIYSAIYDHTTRLDADVDLTMPRLPSISRSMLNQTVQRQDSEVAPSALPASEAGTERETEPAPVEVPVAESTNVSAPETSQVAERAEETAPVSGTGFPEASIGVEAIHTVDMIDMLAVVETMEIPEAVAEDDAERLVLSPLVFPRTLEDVEEEKTFVMPVLNDQYSEGITPLAENEVSQELPSDEPAPSAEPDGNMEKQNNGHILAARKNGHNTPNTPIDITTQKGKYHSTGKRRVRAR